MNTNFQIFTDSSCDLPQERADAYGLHVVPLTVHMDGKNYHNELDGREIAFSDFYAALRYLKENASALGVRNDQIMVGGESAGGGLCAAICIRARDTGEVNVAFQMPLYPMLDDRDTESSRNNHGKIWNTRRNRFAWNLYLRRADRTNLSPYAAPARLRDFAHLPPAYTFVCKGEPFYAETVRYFEQLNAADIPAEIDIYSGNTHAFDMMQPNDPVSLRAAEIFNRRFADAQARYFAPQK